MRLVRDDCPLRGNRAEPAGLVVLEGLDQLRSGVHHERTVRGDGLPDWLTAEDEHVKPFARAVGPAVRAERQHLAGAEYRELTGTHRAPLGAARAGTPQDGAHGIEVI